jgi:uncharacterized protein YbaP (TraB family)
MSSYRIGKLKIFKPLLLIFIIFAVLSGLAGAGVQPHSGQDTSGSCLWSVNTGSHTLYLLGSLHILKPDAYPLATALEEAYASSQKIIFETDLGAMTDPEIQKQMLGLGVYPQGQTLYQHLDEDTLALLQKKMNELGIPPAQFARFKPWFIAVALATAELQRLGFDPTYGIDMYFFKRAKEDHKEIGYLEPPEDQLNLLAEMNAGDQSAFLNQTLKEIDLVAQLAADITAAWKTGDVEDLYALLNKSFEGHPGIRDRLLIQRNEKWALQIEQLMQQKQNILVVVGAAHLVGPKSVVDFLQKKEYKVKQR